jgi:excisionase family DNA binding protein
MYNYDIAEGRGKMDYYTPEQVAEKLQISVRTVWKYIREGQMPASKIGRGYRISEEQLERFMQSQEINRNHQNK